MKKIKLGLIVFVTGFITMGLELVAARIMSPYVGSSNIVWTSIIGIILTSMSLGYYFGGKLAEKNTNGNMLSNILLISSVSISIINLLETVVVKNLSYKIDSLLLSAIISTTILFLIPSFLLSMISPCAVKIISEEEKHIGLASGKISSLSTLGSIIGTFLMGFVLIPNFGVSNIVIGITLALFISSIIIRENWNKKNIIIMIISIVIMLFLFQYGENVFKKSNPSIILDTDSQYSRIWVQQVGNLKSIYVDRGLESYAIGDNQQMAWYLYYFDLFEYFEKDFQNTLMIGGGGYTYPIHYLESFQDKKIDVVEIDQKMTDIAIEYFGLDVNNENLNIYTQDGRSYLNYSDKKYDVILIDAFNGLDIPFELTTYEAFTKAKNILNENGIVMMNIISSIEGKKADFIKYEYQTFKKVFDDVKVFKVNRKPLEEEQNLIIVGFKGSNIDDSKYEKYQQFLNTQIDIISDKQIVTDDFVPIGS